MVTTNNYTEIIDRIGIENLNPDQLQAHENIMRDKADDIFDDLMEDSEYSSVVNAYFSSLDKIIQKESEKKEEFKDRMQEVIQEKMTQDPATKKPAPQAPEKKSAKQAKPKKEKPAKPEKTPIANMPPEFLHIKRYLKMNGQKIKRADLLKQLRSLQNAIAKKVIGKNSKYVDIVRKIQKDWTKAYNSMASTCTITIEDNKVAEMKNILQSFEVDDSVRIIKRFIKFLNKPNKDEASKLLIETEKNLKNTNEYRSEMLTVKKALTDFAAEKEVTIPEYDLRGLAGIAGLDGLGFLPQIATTAAGFVLGRKVLDVINNKPAGTKKPTVINSKDIVNKQFETLPFTGQFETLVGKPSKNFKILIYGPPKMGKSTLAIDFAEYLANNFGKTLFVAAEEGINHTLQEKIKRLKAVHENLYFADSIPNDLSPYQFVFIDSIQRAKLQYDSMTKLINDNPGKGFVFVSQVTKDGFHRGSNEYLHEVDTIIKVEDGTATGYGRFSQGGSVEIDFGS